jgi:HAD superfamily hydrolase (TIGR01509 family)
MIEAVILDFDGLILDTETPFRRSWEEIYEEHGLSVPPAVWAGLIGSSADPPEAYALLERHLGRPVDRTAIRDRRIARELELLKHELVMPGIRSLIEDAKTRSLRLAIASSSEREWVVGHLMAVGLLEPFEVIACAEDVTATKPAPDLYEFALRSLQVSSVQAIAFEDSVHGVAAAKGAGLFCVAVPNRVTQHLAFPLADLVIEILTDHSLAEAIAVADVYYRSPSANRVQEDGHAAARGS